MHNLQAMNYLVEPILSSGIQNKPKDVVRLLSNADCKKTCTHMVY